MSQPAFLTSIGSVSPEVSGKLAKPVVYDVTLRDGEQQAGIAFSEDDKIALFQQLDALGVDIVETGMVAVAAARNWYKMLSTRPTLSATMASSRVLSPCCSPLRNVSRLALSAASTAPISSRIGCCPASA